MRIRFVTLSLFLLFSFKLVGDQVSLNRVTLEYALPSKDYSKEYHINPNNPKQMIIIKFPSVFSEKYQMPIIPNLAIISEQVPEDTTSTDFSLYYISQTKDKEGNIFDGEDDILRSNMPDSMSFFQKYESSGMIHNVYHVFSIYNGVAFTIMFDATDDIYYYYRDTLKEFLNSLHVVH